MREALLCWSGGKDSAMAFHEITKQGLFHVPSLLTTFTRDFDRVSMHGVRRELLEQQAEMLGLPVEKVWINRGADNKEYDARMRFALEKHKAAGVEHVIFGDLFLQDIRRYREERLSELGMHCVFPLWGRETSALARSFIDSGFKAIVCCVDPKALGRDFCGAEFDSQFLSRLPSKVDPCGENGEFHTFVYDGPLFKDGIGVSVGEVVERDGFYFADIVPR
ncbi:MAG: diphthine--ammonia ligase [Nitrososphaerales archaeon]|nr:diphthine--ammonia ligase [Nitrososphaerales archaeon]